MVRQATIPSASPIPTDGTASPPHISVRLGVLNTTLGNADLLWERTTSYDVGLDIALFNSRLEMILPMTARPGALLLKSPLRSR